MCKLFFCCIGVRSLKKRLSLKICTFCPSNQKAFFYSLVCFGSFFRTLADNSVSGGGFLGFFFQHFEERRAFRLRRICLLGAFGVCCLIENLSNNSITKGRTSCFLGIVCPLCKTSLFHLPEHLQVNSTAWHSVTQGKQSQQPKIAFSAGSETLPASKQTASHAAEEEQSENEPTKKWAPCKSVKSW